MKARLVTSAAEWSWSSLRLRAKGHELLDPLPLVLPIHWQELVNAAQPADEVDRIEQPFTRGRPPASRSDA